MLCELLNGTCVLPENCAVLGLTLGYDYGRGSSSDVGKYFTCDDASTICCYPFLLSSLSFLHNRYAGNYYGYNDSDDDDDDDDSGGHLEGFDTVYEYWYPNNRRQLARRLRRPPGRYGRRRPDNKYRDSRRSRYHRNNRPPFPRFQQSIHTSYAFGQFVFRIFSFFVQLLFLFFLNRSLSQSSQSRGWGRKISCYPGMSGGPAKMFSRAPLWLSTGLVPV